MAKPVRGIGTRRTSLERLSNTWKTYPRQFWLLVAGMLVDSVGTSMVWPFLLIYVRQRLGVPLSTVASLFALQSAVGLVSLSIAGQMIDRFGRKGAMLFGLAASSARLFVMSTAGTLPMWAGLMALGGMVGSLYRVAGDVMVADLVEPEQRAGAYALLRTVHNLGVAIGPSIGGLVASSSYALALYLAGSAQAAVALLILLFVSETVPQAQMEVWTGNEGRRGYGQLVRDRQFLGFCSVSILAMISYSLMMILFPVYAKDNFRIPESQFGLILTTNAAMVVLFQFPTTRITQRYRHLPVLAVGSLFYALGVGSVAWGRNFPTFLASMVILTIGEMIMIPTSTALTADLAPPDARGRYMSVYSMAWAAAFGIGPVLGGILNDKVAPVAIWYGGMVIASAAALGFMLVAMTIPSCNSAAAVPLHQPRTTTRNGL